MCGELRLADEGKNVVLNGWVAKARSLGGLVFVDIRDKSGITQVTFNEDVPADVIEKAKILRSEYCIGVNGTVKERSSKNPNLDTGDIEVFAEDLVIYSSSETPPIYIKDDDIALRPDTLHFTLKCAVACASIYLLPLYELVALHSLAKLLVC